MSSTTDYHVTLSPRGDLAELPEKVRDFLTGGVVSRCYAVAEHASKWHVHIVIVLTSRTRQDSVRRTFLSMCKGDEWGAAAIVVKPIKSCSPEGIAGGYLNKSSDTRLLLNRGFEQDDLKRGAAEYEGGKARERVRNYLDKLVPVSREKYIPALAAALHEAGTEDSAVATAWLVANGFAFSSSVAARDFGAVLSLQRSHYEFAGGEGEPSSDMPADDEGQD